MVLSELGSKISGALSSLINRNVVVDQAALDAMLKDIGNALVGADVNFKLVMHLRANIKNKVNLESIPLGINKGLVIKKIVFDEICSLLDPGVEPYMPVKGRANVLMFVGLQGAGKTTTVAKLAHYYKRKGWKAALVCADTFRAGAFDQLKQNATKVMVPYYGSYSEPDPAKVAMDGVEYFKRQGYEIIIVDTSGRNKQDSDLFEELRKVSTSIYPNEVLLVIDSTIGQAAYDQALAFKQPVKVGGMIVTKMDSHAKGGGALSAVAATKSPLLFFGSGEHMDDLEPFVAQRFVKELLGMGNIETLMEKIKDAMPTADNQAKLRKRLQQGNFTLRDMYEQFQSLLKLGPLNKVLEMIPGISQLLKQTNSAPMDVGARVRSYLAMMDSMTQTELDDNKAFENKKTRDSRLARIAHGSGHTLREVNGLLEQFKHFQAMFKRGQLPIARNAGQLSKFLPHHLIQQINAIEKQQVGKI